MRAINWPLGCCIPAPPEAPPQKNRARQRRRSETFFFTNYKIYLKINVIVSVSCFFLEKWSTQRFELEKQCALLELSPVHGSMPDMRKGIDQLPEEVLMHIFSFLAPHGTGKIVIDFFFFYSRDINNSKDYLFIHLFICSCGLIYSFQSWPWWAR